MDGGSYPVSDMALLYRKLLESDEHTGAGGWPEYFTPEEMDRNNRIHLGYATDARDISADLKTQALDRLLADLPVSAEAIVAINPLGRARDGWVRTTVPAGLYSSDFHVVDRTTSTELAFQRFPADSSIGFHATDLPAWGYRVYDLIPGAPTAAPGGSLQATATSLENDSYQVTLDPATGALTSIFDKLVSIKTNNRGNLIFSVLKQRISGLCTNNKTFRESK